MSRVARLRRLGRDEAVWRLRAAARVQRDRLAAGIRTPRWDRRALRTVLTPGTADAVLTSAIDRNDWLTAHQAVSERLRNRASRFMLDPTHAAAFRSSLITRWPHAESAARAGGDAIIRGRYDVLGYRDVSYVHDGHAVDWHYDPIHNARTPRQFWADVPYLDPSCGDHKVIWEINRQQHWQALGRAWWLTGDAKYAHTIVAQLEDWLEANPPLMGVNWASMLELGFRSISWVYGLHFLLARDAAGSAPVDDRPWLVDLLVGLDRQLTHVEQNLSRYFSPNTHLTGEALALYVAGRALPELARAERWSDVGRRILLDEIGVQILPDGGHAERSLHYHRYTLDFYLCALLVAERSGDLEAAGHFRAAAGPLARFARALADDNGQFATIGDDDGGMLWRFADRRPADIRDSLALAAVVLDEPGLAPWGAQEELCWALGHVPGDTPATVRARAPRPISAAFADTGYAVMRDAHHGHLIFDVGTHGYLNGGHAHADALAVTLSLEGAPLLIDPGTATYTINTSLRDHFRHSSSHNTVVVDGSSSSEPLGPFHWRSRTDSVASAWRANSRFAWAEAHHDGFAGVRHRRSVAHATGAGWFIVDELLGRGRHAVDVNWHFDPAWQVTCDTKTLLRAVHRDGRTAWVAHDDGGLSLVRGDDESAAGWCAPEYGLLVPMWSARFSHSVLAPATLVTWIGQGDNGHAWLPRVTRLHVDADPGHGACAVRVIAGNRSEIVLLRPGDAIGRESRGASVADYHTDARLFHMVTRDGDVCSITLADGSHALALHDGLLSIACDRRVDDVCVVSDGDVIDIAASAPLPRVQIQGAAAERARLVRVNGRERPLVRDGRRDAIVVSSEHPHRVLEERAQCVA